MPQDSHASFEVVIVGAGPAGLAAGAEAARCGISHVVLERGNLANTIFKYQKKKFVMAEPGGLPVRKKLTISFNEDSRENVLEAFSAGTRAAGTNLWIGPENEVTAISGAVGEFAVHLSDGRTLACQRVVLALGLQGNLRKFGVPGDDLPHATYQLDDPDEHVDQNIVVIGVGDAGIENALALKDRNYVTVVNRVVEIDRAKGKNKLALLDAINAREIAYLTNTGVKQIEPGCIILKSREGELRLPADLIIGRLGAMPPRKFLEDLGIRFPSPNPDAVPAVSGSSESNVPGIYLIGALAGYQLIKQCLNQGCEVIEHIVHKPNESPVEVTEEPVLRKKGMLRPGESVSDLLERIRRAVPLYSGLLDVPLREFLSADGTKIVRPKPGETIYRRGEGGRDFDPLPGEAFDRARIADDERNVDRERVVDRSSDDFYAILEGAVEVVAPSVDAEGDAIYADIPMPESMSTTIQLTAGEFFGEGSLIADRRRTATVIAGANCVLLSAPRFAMTKLMKMSPEVKRTIDEVFVLRKLQNAFAPKRQGASDIHIEEIRELARASGVEVFQQGETLWNQDRAWFVPPDAWFKDGDSWFDRAASILGSGDAWLEHGAVWYKAYRELVAQQLALASRRDDLSRGRRDSSSHEVLALRKLGRDFADAVDAWFGRGAAWLESAPPAPAAAAQPEAAASGKFRAWLQEGKSWFARRERSSGLHLIRRGSVTVSMVEAGQETVLSYLSAGSLIGEMALLTPDGLRSAAVRANVLTETIRLPGAAVVPFIERHPGLHRAIDQLITRRLDENVARAADLRSGDVVSFLVKAGAGEATDIILIDESICIRCDNCERACADTHGGVSRLDREAGPTFASVHVPTSCRHCENPKCMTDCPASCIHRHPTGEIFIDTKQCIGCGNCVSYCPYNVIQMAEQPARPATGIVGLLASLVFGERRADAHHAAESHHKKAVKCDLCHDLPVRKSRDDAGASACVSSCPTGALRRVNPKHRFEELLPK